MAGLAGTGPPGAPRHLRGQLVEVARREWHDPATFQFGELEAFLRASGVCGSPAGGSARPAGAAILLGGDLRQTGPPSRPCRSPAPAVPAACAVVYAAGARSVRATRGLPTPGESARIGAWTPSWTRQEYLDAIGSVRAAIAAGEVYQVNIVGHQSAPYEGPHAAAGRALATLAHTPYAGAMSGAGWSVFSASPECLLDVSGGVATTRPIKGTAAVGLDPETDEDAADGLRASLKDRAEHIMIVDLARNDLGRIAEVGGVSVPELYAVRRLAGVWHAESTVRAVVRPGVDVADLLAAVFPGGSVTGAPKLAALQLIDSLEKVGRGPAMGAMGWVGSDGEIRLGLTIRTVAIAEGRIHLWTGGGVTWGSDPQGEVAEAAVKAAPLLAALQGLTRSA